MWSRKQAEAPPAVVPETATDIAALSVEELAIRRKELDDEIGRRGVDELDRLKDKLILVANALGYGVADLFPAQKPEKKQRKKRQARKPKEEVAEELPVAAE
jgi:hypothetical protein